LSFDTCGFLFGKTCGLFGSKSNSFLLGSEASSFFFGYFDSFEAGSLLHGGFLSSGNS